MREVVPESSWHACSGPRGTVVFSDTCSVYHRGTIAHSEDRHALFFCYNSRSPRSPGDCQPLFDRARPIRSTGDMGTWYTGKPCERTERSHINFCVYDSTWEASEAFELDHNRDVAAWVKNDHLG